MIGLNLHNHSSADVDEEFESFLRILVSKERIPYPQNVGQIEFLR